MQPFGRNIYGPKIGGTVPFWGRAAGSPSNTMWPGSRPTCMPSFILIRPTVWPRCTNVTDRQDRQTGQTDNGLIAQGEPFYKWSPKNTTRHNRTWPNQWQIQSITTSEWVKRVQSIQLGNAMIRRYFSVITCFPYSIALIQVLLLGFF